MRPLRSNLIISPAAVRWLSAGPRSRPAVGPLIRVYGPVVIAAYMLAAGRWGSYLIPGPPYVGDLALIVVVGERVRALALRRTAMGNVELTLGIATGALLLWVCLRFLFGHFSTDAVRDFAPYAYSVIVLLTPSRPNSPQERAVMERLLFAALIFHAAWASLDLIFPSLSNHLPALGGGQSRLLELRPDYDSTVCGIAVFLCLQRVITGRRPLLHLALLVWNLAIVLDDHSRAAVAALAVQFVLYMVLTPAARQLLRRYGLRIILTVVLVAVPVGVIAASHSGPIQRLSKVGGSFLPIVPTTGNPGANANGTSLARRRAWQAIERYLEARSSRDIAGVGFGPDFLHDSGGDELLLGGVNQDVRQPHNYLINTWARIGLVGLGLISLLMLAFLRLSAHIGRSGRLDDLDVLTIVTAAGLFTAACYGVILETPFGAMPFFWALGALGTRALELDLSPALRRA